MDTTITTEVDSIKNPLSGRIVVTAVGEIIRDDADSKGEIQKILAVEEDRSILTKEVLILWKE